MTRTSALARANPRRTPRLTGARAAKIFRVGAGPTQISPRRAALVSGVRRLSSLVAIALVVVPTAVAAAPLSVTMTSVHDATLYGGADEVEFGDGAGRALFAGFNNEIEERRALLQFDLSQAVPLGSTISSAELRLVVTRGQLGSARLEIHRVTASWAEGSTRAGGNEGAGTTAAEGDVTWSQRVYPSMRWTTAGGDFAASASATASVGSQGTLAKWSDAGLVDDLQRWLADPTTNFGWIVLSPDNGVARRFGSREGGAGARPQLTVTFTPPAGGVGACCSGRGACGYALASGGACQGTFKGAESTCDESTCPPPVGACCRPDATAACSVQTRAACAGGGGVWSDTAETCAPNPCPVVLTPFVDELPRPAVAMPASTSADGTAQYRMSIIQTTQKLHRDLPATTVWGFSDGHGPGGYPGPTIEAKVEQPIDVTWVNDLRDGSGAFLQAHPLHVDSCPHGASDGPPRVAIHLHGGHTPSDSDGLPEQVMVPGQSKTFHYPNHQRAATLWYHDHAMGVTRLDVMMGMAGYYVLRDDAEAALGLPSGEYDVPLAVQDRTFLPDGSLFYPANWQEEFYGNTILVNGKVWPYLNVKRAAYRFRLLNGSTSRTYKLSLDPFLPMVQIAGDGGLLRSGVARDSVLIGPGERAEVVVDFGAPGADRSYTLVNQAPAPYPNGDDQYAITNVMKFVVGAEIGPGKAFPVYLRPDPGELDPGAARLTRDIVLQRSGDGCGGGTWLINGLGYHDPITERPHLGTTEIWRFVNHSGSPHTMHTHLTMFEVLDRQFFTVQGDMIVPKGTATPADLPERGWKDTVLLKPFEMVRVVTRFEDYAGRYVYHCHMLEHEEHEMMRPYEALPACPDAGCPEDLDGGADAAGCEGGAGACPGAAPAAPTSGCSCGLNAGAPSRGPGLYALVGLLLVVCARRVRPRGHR
jgi:spore coat protein A